MKRAGYNGDPRYWSVWEKMQLLGIEDVSSAIQEKGGTIIWRLPIRNNNSGKTFIEVGSFSTGYVRNQNSGYSNYQLNKRCQGEPQYYPERKYNPDTNEYVKTGKYLKFETRTCKLIPVEIDRLEYLLSYCVKNYFIKRANEVADGKYISKWYHEFELGRANETYGENTGAMARIEDLEEKLDAMTEDRDCKSDTIIKLEDKLSNAISPTKYQCAINKLGDLENRLATIKHLAE